MKSFTIIERSFAIINLVFILTACKKFTQVDAPKTQIVSETVYSNDVSATAAINGIYSQMMSSSGFASGGPASITMLAGLSADELINYSVSSDQSAFYLNTLTSSNETLNNALWAECYTDIYYVNAMLAGLKSGTVSISLNNQLTGEAKFLRAFYHFYLVNLFGDIPFVTSTDYRVNNLIRRLNKSEAYKQILADLGDASSLLKDDYISGIEKIRPNRGAAIALMARVYLYNSDWPNAEFQASLLINGSQYSLENDLNNVFLKNSSEAIWQLKPVIENINTQEGNLFILTTTPGAISLNPLVYNSFENGDNRKTNWIDSLNAGGMTYYFPFKYKISQGSDLYEYSMVLRLAEQYLIRAEARVELGNIAGAVADINIIRVRAGLSSYTGSTDKISLLNVILHERRAEFFSEWGHRWLDIKRTGKVDSVMKVASIIKGTLWNSNQQLYPIPQIQLSNDPNITQNPGY